MSNPALRHAALQAVRRLKFGRVENALQSPLSLVQSLLRASLEVWLKVLLIVIAIDVSSQSGMDLL